ncbi:MAG: hypothetical protein ABJF50_00640 [Paracoccaceae bacterium]
MTTDTHSLGFWAGMPKRLKATLIAWLMYWALAIWLASVGSLIGIALLISPLFWFLAKAWVFDSFLELEARGVGLLDYTLGRIWNGSAFVRTTFLTLCLAVALGGLGWFGTADLRKAASEPTLIEQISDGASNALDSTVETSGAALEATKETTRGWLDRAKGWFRDEKPPQ